MLSVCGGVRVVCVFSLHVFAVFVCLCMLCPFVKLCVNVCMYSCISMCLFVHVCFVVCVSLFEEI